MLEERRAVVILERSGSVAKDLRVEGKILDSVLQQEIKANLESIQNRIGAACRRAGRSTDEVTMIAATKTISPEMIENVFNLGLRNFGENRVQEAEKKVKLLSHLQPRPTWHMIGHLQSNKVNTALAIFDIIQGIDSLALAEAISRRTAKIFPLLLEVNMAGEAAKSGFSPAEIEQAFEAIRRLPNIEVRGLMIVAPLVENAEEVRPVFRELRHLRDKFKLKHLSMGMTDDFEVAIEEGATMIRIGRGIFGERE
jgi:PLP dependent protein